MKRKELVRCMNIIQSVSYMVFWSSQHSSNNKLKTKMRKDLYNSFLNSVRKDIKALKAMK
jgi:hypothetical protein